MRRAAFARVATVGVLVSAVFGACYAVRLLVPGADSLFTAFGVSAATAFIVNRVEPRLPWMRPNAPTSERN